MKQTTKKTMAFLLAVVLLFSVFGVPSAWAGDTDDAQTNLALNKPAVATYSQEGYPVENAVDGNLSTYWGSSHSSGGTNQFPQAVQIDLEQACRLDSVRIAWVRESTRQYSFQIYVTDTPLVTDGGITDGAASTEAEPIVTSKTISGVGGDHNNGKWTGTPAGADQTVSLKGYNAIGRYLTIAVTANSNNNGIAAIWEIEAYGDPTGTPVTYQNITSGKQVTATFAQDGYPVENVVDGDFSTRWGTYGSQCPQYLQMDLEETTALGYLRASWYVEPSRPYKTNIYVSDTPVIQDGVADLTGLTPITAYTTRSGGTSSTSSGGWAGDQRIDLNHAEGRYLVIEVTSAVNNTASIWELEVYAEVKSESEADEILSENILSNDVAYDQEAGAYDLTWNVSVTNSLDPADAQTFVDFNDAYEVVDAGILVTADPQAAEDAKALAMGDNVENPAASVQGKAYKESFGTTVYSHFSYRRTGVAEDRVRVVITYIVYQEKEGNGELLYAFSEASSMKATNE